MIDPFLAELIIEHGEDFFPFLRLIAESVKYDKKIVNIPPTITVYHIDVMERSGLLKRIGDDKVELGDDSGFYFKPKPIQRREKKEEKQYLPETLMEITRVFGLPIDWFKSRNKYRAMYFRMLKNVKEEEMKKVLEFCKKNEIEGSVSIFLSKNGFPILWDMMLNPQKTDKKKQTGRTDFGDYDAPQPF